MTIPSSTRHQLTRLLDERLEDVLSNPGGWGGTEALEPVVLMLWLLRAELGAPSMTFADVLQRYRSFLALKVGPGAAGLRERLGNRATLTTMVEILREFGVHMSTRASASEPGAPGQPRRRVFPALQSVDREAA